MNEIDRRGTNSIKWEFMESEDQPGRMDHTDRSFAEGGVLPMWVADMDFRSPEPVIQALVRQRAEWRVSGMPRRPRISFFRWSTG